jgi:hypothetical protein
VRIDFFLSFSFWPHGRELETKLAHEDSNLVSLGSDTVPLPVVLKRFVMSKRTSTMHMA